MQCLQITRGIFERFAFGEAGSASRDIDHVRAQPQGGQLERCAGTGARLDKEIHQRFSTQRRHLLNLAGTDLFERVSGVQDEIDFVCRKFAQAQQIFSCPARGHSPTLPGGCHRGIRGAHACSVLAKAFRLRELFLEIHKLCRLTRAQEEVRFGGTPKPARCKRALPGNCAFTLILFPATRRPVRYQFLARAPGLFRHLRWANSSRRNRGEWVARDDRGRQVLRAEFVRAVRMS